MVETAINYHVFPQASSFDEASQVAMNPWDPAIMIKSVSFRSIVTMRQHASRA